MNEVIEKVEELAMLFVQMQEKYVELLNAIKRYCKGESGESINNMSAEDMQKYVDKCENCSDKCPYEPWSPNAFCNRPKGDIEWDENW